MLTGCYIFPGTPNASTWQERLSDVQGGAILQIPGQPPGTVEWHAPPGFHGGASFLGGQGLVFEGRVLSPAGKASDLLQEYLVRRDVTPFLANLDGAFALAVWDRGTLSLAVDPLGRFPLYYWIGAETLIFSTDLDQVSWLSGCHELDLEAFNLYFDLKGIPAPWSLYKGISKVVPGRAVNVNQEGQTSETDYWDLASLVRVPYVDDCESAKRELRERLSEAVRERCADATFIGVLLSGGIDSTIVTALAKKYSTVRAFSAGYAGHLRFDETPYARVAAEGLGVPLTIQQLAPSQVPGLLNAALPIFSEPVADMAFVPEAWLCQQVDKDVPGLLDGTGADGVFGGSNKYVADYVQSLYVRLPGWLRSRLIEPLAWRLPASRGHASTDAMRKFQIFLGGYALPDAERTIRYTRFFAPEAKKQLVRPELDLGDAVLRRCLERTTVHLDGSRKVSEASYLTLKNLMSWVELHKLHTLEKATGIRIETPFLDPGVVMLGLSLPDAFKVRRTTGKLIVRQAYKNQIPPAILRRPKSNFVPAIGEWIKHELRSYFWDTMRSGPATRWYNQTSVEEMYRQHAAGQKDWQSELWATLVMQSWLTLHRVSV